jgi:hypothetical protein
MNVAAYGGDFAISGNKVRKAEKRRCAFAEAVQDKTLDRAQGSRSQHRFLGTTRRISGAGRGHWGRSLNNVLLHAIRASGTRAPDVAELDVPIACASEGSSRSASASE